MRLPVPVHRHGLRSGPAVQIQNRPIKFKTDRLEPKSTVHPGITDTGAGTVGRDRNQRPGQLAASDGRVSVGNRGAEVSTSGRVQQCPLWLSSVPYGLWHRSAPLYAQPTLEAIKRLAVALSVSTDTLAFGEDERGPSDDLKLQFEALSAFDPEDKAIARVVIESLILRYQSKRWIEQKDQAS